MRLAPVTWLCLSLAWAVACGGRYSHTTSGSDDGDDDPSGTAGKSSGHAGKSSSGGGANVGGTGSGFGGTVVTGGTVAVGGSSTCGPCMVPMCPVGTAPIAPAGECCPRCLPVECKNPNCGVPVGCPPGSHLEQPPGNCCPICVPGQDCNMQRASYEEFKKQLVEKYSSLGCMVPSDCDVLYTNNACGADCGIALPAPYIKDAAANLDGYAQMTCANLMCPPIPVPPCEPPAVTCINGRCQLF